MDNSFTTGSAWGILPEEYESTYKKYKTLNSDSNILSQAITFQAEPPKLKTILKEVVTIDIKGSIFNSSSFISYMLNGAIIPNISEQLKQAEQTNKVKAIVLDIDSPGGTIGGVQELSAQIKAINKPVIAYTAGMMCSAAYWIASAADQIIASPTAQIGSIGVLLVHTDYSKMGKQDGIETTVLKAGKYKAIGNPYEPLSKDDRKNLQEKLDYLYSIFVESVAGNRNISVKDALKMADGRVFIGQQALDIGLIDKVGTMNDALNNALLFGKSDIAFYKQTGVKPKGQTNMSEINSLEEIKQAFPDLTEKIFQEGAKSVDSDALVAYEQARIMNLAKAHFGAEGERFEKIIKTGVTLEQYQAMKSIEPEKAEKTKDLKAEILAELQKDSHDNPGTTTKNDSSKTYMEAIENFKSQGMTATEAMKKAAKEYPDLYKKHARGGV